MMANNESTDAVSPAGIPQKKRVPSLTQIPLLLCPFISARDISLAILSPIF
jgi:hypothetical protein